MQTLHGTVLQPHSAEACEIIPKTVVRVDYDGRIAEIGTGTTQAKDVIGDESCWILPGFIDAHLHLPQWDRRGINGMSLIDWHENVVFPAEARFKDPAFAEHFTDKFVTDLIANGTTTIAAFGSPFAEATDRSFAVFARRGYRAIFGKTLNDMNCPDLLREPTERILNEARALAGKWHGVENGRLNYAFSPRTPVCCSEELMQGTAALSDLFKCHIQTHVAESVAEVAAVRDKFPDKLDDVEVFTEMGLLTPRTLLGHGVFLSHQQRRQVAESRASVVHCPTANLFLESGIMDYVAHRSMGIRVALGSSIAGGHEIFMPRVAVAALQSAKAVKLQAIPRGSHRAPKPAEAWWLLTRGGAEALGFGDRIGAIETGYEADLLVVRPVPWIADLPTDQQLSTLLYTLTPQQIKHVFIAGNRVGP